MQGGGRLHKSNTRLEELHNDLVPRDFMSSLFKAGGDKCVEYLGKDIHSDKEKYNFCRNEVMVAASCVLLSKTNQVGDYRNNVGICKHEIRLAKKYLNEKFNDFPNTKLDDWMNSLSLSTKSFC